jgi:Tat protein translocase TatC
VPLDDPSLRRALDAEELPRMSFGDHLDELRKRLVRSIIAVVIAVVAMVPFHDQVMGLVVEPYRILWKQGFEDYLAHIEERDKTPAGNEPEYKAVVKWCRENKERVIHGTYPLDLVHQIPILSGYKVPYELMAAGGIEDFWTFMMASMIFALVLASPVVIWQAWAFVAAGLYERERAVFYRYFPFMMVLLAAGVLFGYLVAVPYGLGALIKLQVPGLVSSMLTVGNYFALLFALTAALGVVFQLPLVMVALQRIGLVRHETMVKNWRMAVLLIFALAVVISPPDPFSMMLLAVPMLGLYALGLLLTRGARSAEPAPGATS